MPRAGAACSGTESGDELDLDRNAERQLGEADRGAGMAPGITEDLLPESAVFGSFSTTEGTCIRKAGPQTPEPKGGLVSCKLGSLEGGKTATITITVTATKPGTLNAKATVTAYNVTSDENDKATATTTVLGD